jgi:hypothetical protein
MGTGRGTKALLVGAVAATAALIAASTAVAAPTYSTQYGNNTALACLQAPRWSGVMTVTSVIRHLNVDRNKRVGANIDLDYDLTVFFQPNNPAQPSYTGKMKVSQHDLAIPFFAPSYDLPMSINLQGSDGSSATLAGGQTLSFTWKSDRNVQISISDDGWDCA